MERNVDTLKRQRGLGPEKVRAHGTKRREGLHDVLINLEHTKGPYSLASVTVVCCIVDAPLPVSVLVKMRTMPRANPAAPKRKLSQLSTGPTCLSITEGTLPDDGWAFMCEVPLSPLHMALSHPGNESRQQAYKHKRNKVLLRPLCSLSNLLDRRTEAHPISSKGGDKTNHSLAPN